MKLKAIFDEAAKGKFILPTILVLILSLTLGNQFVCGQQTSGTAKVKNDTAEIKFEKNENYRIGPGDVIDVIVVKNETLSQMGIRVSNQGSIQLKMLEGDFQAACLTERELADQIREKYKKYLLQPYVNVAVKEFNANPVAFIGAVQKPVSIQLQRPMQLLDLLTLANGPSPNAGETIQIIRNPNVAHCDQKTLVTPTGSDNELLTFSLAKTLEGAEEANPFVQSGDVVRLMEAEQVQAYIIGSVKTPGTINLKEPVTLTQAVAMAGGIIPGSKIEKVTISRSNPGSLENTSTVVNLKAINERKASDVLLQPNDVVEIPGPKKSILNKIITTILQRAPIPIL